MQKSKPRTSLPLDPFLAGRILLKLDPANAAIFADVLRLAFNKDEPRDDRGRWTTGGSGAAPCAAKPARPTRSQDPLSVPRPTGAWGDLDAALQATVKSAAAKAEAARIAAAIRNTWSKNWTLYAPWAQTTWGYWCYEWAYAFERAAGWEAGSGRHFTVELWSATTDDGTRVHAWVKITSKETGQSIYVDDGFWDGKYVHSEPPYGGAYKNLHRGVDTPRNECSPPPAYDFRGRRVPSPPRPAGSPEPGLQSPGFPDPAGFPWIF